MAKNVEHGVNDVVAATYSMSPGKGCEKLVY